jgi:hypothetical protein
MVGTAQVRLSPPYECLMILVAVAAIDFISGKP